MLLVIVSPAPLIPIPPARPIATVRQRRPDPLRGEDESTCSARLLWWQHCDGSIELDRVIRHG
ncbi:hypothetical protein AB0F43_31825 [Kribbella sp. NPDC023972]|uniref:hypothetical protein n=1 Tax=Kribbella sp. NPDC023972 TaxID=3154795 RepID=UPI0033C6CBBC